MKFLRGFGFVSCGTERMFVTMKTEYTYAAAYVKSLEKNMLTDADFEMLTGLDSDEIIRFLADRGYEGADFEEMLENERQKTWELCRELCGDDPLFDAFMTENDFHNIKAVLKATVSGSDFSELIYEPSGIDVQGLANAFKTGDYSNIDDDFAEICKKAYSIYTKTLSGREVELYIDKMQLLKRLELSRGNAFMYGLCELLSFIADLKIYLREKSNRPRNAESGMTENSLIDIHFLTESGKSKEETLSLMGLGDEYRLFERSEAEFEKLCDDKISEYLKRAKMSFFDFDALAAYFEGKKIEIKNLRLLLYGKRSGVSKKDLAERLRKSYV